MGILINFNQWELFSVLEEKLFAQKRKAPFRCLRCHKSRRCICQRLYWARNRPTDMTEVSISRSSESVYCYKQLSLFYYRGLTYSYKRLRTFSCPATRKIKLYDSVVKNYELCCPVTVVIYWQLTVNSYIVIISNKPTRLLVGAHPVKIFTKESVPPLFEWSRAPWFLSSKRRSEIM